MAMRQEVERRSAPVLVALARQPRWFVALIVTALFAGLLLLPTVPAALCLLVLVTFVCWLTFLSWPGLDRGARVVRVAAGLVLLALGLSAVL